VCSSLPFFVAYSLSLSAQGDRIFGPIWAQLRVLMVRVCSSQKQFQFHFMPVELIGCTYRKGRARFHSLVWSMPFWTSERFTQRWYYHYGNKPRLFRRRAGPWSGYITRPSGYQMVRPPIKTVMGSSLYPNTGNLRGPIASSWSELFR
jgi:hypothetical protein